MSFIDYKLAEKTKERGIQFTLILGDPGKA